MAKKTLSLIFLITCFGQVAFSQCGVERWAIKTLTDPDTTEIDFKKIVPSNIHEQISLPPPEHIHQYKRSQSETTVYSIPSAIVAFKREKDSDIHVVVEDVASGETMVIELVSADCVGMQTSRNELFRSVEHWFIKHIGEPTDRFTYLRTHIPVTITGVGFFDFCHGQKGMAENCREIHPVLDIQFIKK